MIDNTSGAVTMLSSQDFRVTNPPPGYTVLFGSEPEIRRLGRAVALGEKELANRATRRKQQRASRKRNR